MKISCHITANKSSTDAAASPPNPVLPLTYEMIELVLATGELTIVTGPNGVGKSALLGEIARSCGHDDSVETFFGGRSIIFDSENVDSTERDIHTTNQQVRQNTTRYRQPNRDQQFRSVMRRIINAQTQSTENAFQAVESGLSTDDAKIAHPRPLNTINGIFETALLPIELVLRDGLLKAKRGAIEYGIDRLSDGERAALLVAGAVVVRPANSFIVIDEPERHLNPAISGPLLSSLVRARPDVGYIFATHDLELIQWLRPNQVIHVRDSVVIEPVAEARRFELSILSGENDLPEELRYSILGSRKKLLLVEGAATSEDQALYRHIYPGWNIVARGGWETVRDGVRSLSRNKDYHWLTTAGIIDRDGRGASEQLKLARDGVHCLPTPTIENLFLHPAILKCMADAAYELQGGDTGDARLETLNEQLPSMLGRGKSEIVARRVVWEANRLLSTRKLSVQDVRDRKLAVDAVDLAPVLAKLECEFDVAVNSKDAVHALGQLPVKNTSIPKAVAATLGYENFSKYKTAVLRQIESGSEAGLVMKATLKAALPALGEDPRK